VARRAVQEPSAYPVLQSLDLPAERLLRHEQPLRGTGEVQLLRDRHVVPQRADLQVVGHRTFLPD
jgi:hypothetical protein